MKTYARSLSLDTFRGPSLALAAVVALAACDASDPVGPDVDEGVLTAESQMVLAVLGDADAVEAGIAVAESPVAERLDAGRAGAASARSTLDLARSGFDEARSALARGDLDEAVTRATDARRSLARALDESPAVRGSIGAVERAEALPGEVTADPESYVDPGSLAIELSDLAERARGRMASGDRVGAVSDAILAEQLHELRRRDRPDRDRVDLAIALAGTAIELATRLLPDDPEPEQLRFLRVAERHLRAAVALAEAGQTGRAVHQAELAVWNALKAVVLPGGVSEEEQRMILDLAETLFAEARATEPEGVKATLLGISLRLLEHGTAQLEAGNVRGVAALWSSAVISTWIIG